MQLTSFSRVLAQILMQFNWAVSIKIYYTNWHVRLSKAQISLRIRAVWSESSICALWVAKCPTFLQSDNLVSDKTVRMRRLFWIKHARTYQLVHCTGYRLVSYYNWILLDTLKISICSHLMIALFHKLMQELDKMGDKKIKDLGATSWNKRSKNFAINLLNYWINLGRIYLVFCNHSTQLLNQFGESNTMYFATILLNYWINLGRITPCILQQFYSIAESFWGE